MLRFYYAVVLVICSLVVAQAQSQRDSLIAKFEAPDHRIQDVAFSFDGKWIAAGYGFYDDGGVTIWNIASRRIIATLLEKESKRGGINKIAFSPDGKLFAAADSNGNVWIWKVGEWRNKRKIIIGKGDSNGLVFSPDSTKLAFSSEENCLLYDITSNSIDVISVGKEGENEFDGVSFTPDGKAVVVSGSKGTQSWDVSRKKTIKLWNNPGFNFFGGLSPKGKYFVSGGGSVYGEKSIKIRNFPHGELVKDLTEFRDGVFALAISNGDQYLALSGGTYGGENAGFFSLWSLDKIDEIGFAAFGESPIQGLAFNYDDSVLAVGSYIGEVRLYDVKRLRGKQLEKQKEPLCGEFQTEDGKSFIRAISKLPGIMSGNFVYPWRLEITDLDSVKNVAGLPIILREWFIVSSSANDKAKIADYKTFLNSDDDAKNYIVFGVGENPGFGYAVKVFRNGSFLSADRNGKCLSYGNLSKLKTDYQSVKKRLLDEDFLSIPKEPLTIGAAHFRTAFIEIVVDGVSELRTDADSFELLMKEEGRTIKREAFSKIWVRERPFIDRVLAAGFQ